MIGAATKDDRALVLELPTEFEAEVPAELWDDHVFGAARTSRL